MGVTCDCEGPREITTSAAEKSFACTVHLSIPPLTVNGQGSSRLEGCVFFSV